MQKSRRSPTDDPARIAARCFGLALRAARLDAQLSLAALAQRVGININYLWRIEMGRENPTFVICQRLVDATGYRFLPGLAVVKVTEPSPHISSKPEYPEP